MIEENLRKIKEVIERVSPMPRRVKLIVVTKNVGAVRMLNAISAGAKHIGESKIQDAERKFRRLKEVKVTKHLIGHLQQNKVRKAVELFDVIHSVDSLGLAQKIDEACQLGRKIDILLQVNTSGEKTKYGIRPSEIGILKEIAQLRNLRLVGLMTMAPFIKPEYTRPYFGITRMTKIRAINPRFP